MDKPNEPATPGGSMKTRKQSLRRRLTPITDFATQLESVLKTSGALGVAIFAALHILPKRT
jgi:hypothetical protein